LNCDGEDYVLSLSPDPSTSMNEVGLTCLTTGISKPFQFYGPKSRGGRIFQLSHNKQPIFRVDYHKLNKFRESPKRLHYHRGLSNRGMRAHRPYEGGW